MIVIFSLKFRYRPPNDFLVPFLQIDFNYSCVKYASYELHQMKKEGLIYKLYKYVSFINYNRDLYDKTSIILGFVLLERTV